MLKSVMRRFGPAKNGYGRPFTYLEPLLEEACPRVQQALEADADADPFFEIAKAIVRLECEREHFEAPDFDDDQVQGAVIAYFRLLLDNDALPPGGQLEEKDLSNTRTLLLSASVGAEDTVADSDRVLALLEEKFNSGKFTQAAILLRLFDTTPARERNNERTLFYEEMFSRFGVLRLNRIGAGQCRKYKEIFKGKVEPLVALSAAAEWLGTKAGVHLNLALRNHEEQEAWETVWGGVPDSNSLAISRDLVPPRRWRNGSEHSFSSLLDAVDNHIDTPTVVEYFGHLLKVCYFIVLVTGKTGFEPYIQSYFRWVEENFGFKASTILPNLHHETTIGERGLAETVFEVLRVQMLPYAAQLREELEGDKLAEALASFVDALEDLDPNEIPPGEYDLAGLLLDHLTGLEVDDRLTAFRIHRIC